MPLDIDLQKDLVSNVLKAFKGEIDFTAIDENLKPIAFAFLCATTYVRHVVLKDMQPEEITEEYLKSTLTQAFTTDILCSIASSFEMYLTNYIK